MKEKGEKFFQLRGKKRQDECGRETSSFSCFCFVPVQLMDADWYK